MAARKKLGLGAGGRNRRRHHAFTLTQVEELFAAMDTNGDGECTKHELLDFLREHKPKHGKWASTAKLQKHFGLASKIVITVADLREGFRSAKDLRPGEL